MNDGDLLTAFWGVGVLALALSALFARRLKFSHIARNILIWAAIFAAAYGVFLFSDDIGGVIQRARADLGGAPETGASGSSVILRRASDGHFYANASVNGTSVRFLIDSGATVTSLSRSLANTAGVAIDDTGFPVMVETANGNVLMKRGMIASLDVGGIHVDDGDVLISEAIGETPVLGMSFLSAMHSWRVEDATLVLEP